MTARERAKSERDSSPVTDNCHAIRKMGIRDSMIVCMGRKGKSAILNSLRNTNRGEGIRTTIILTKEYGRGGNKESRQHHLGYSIGPYHGRATTPEYFQSSQTKSPKVHR